MATYDVFVFELLDIRNDFKSDSATRIMQLTLNAIKETMLPINNLILFPKHHMQNEQSGLEEPEHSKSAGREEPLRPTRRCDQAL